MKSGFKVYWTDFALTELENTVQYLESNFSEKELKTLAQEIEHTEILFFCRGTRIRTWDPLVPNQVR
jgi:hypothetical protein